MPSSEVSTPSPVAVAIAGTEGSPVESLRTLLESMGDGFFACDAAWRILYLNAEGGKLLDLRPAAALGRDYWALFPLARETVLEREMERAAAGELREFEYYHQPWGRWFHYRCFPRAGGGVVGYFHEITVRKRTEEQLRRNHDTFYHLIHNNPFGIYVIDSDFKLSEVSRGAQKVFQNVRPLLGQDFADVLRVIWPEPFASDAIARFRHTLATGESFVAPGTVERRNDIAQVEAYDWRIERITLPDGRFGVVCYFYDWSELLQWQAALRDSEKRFRELAESMPHLVWTATPDGVVDYYNSRVDRYSGLARDEAGAWQWRPVLHPDDLEATAAAWRAAVERQENYAIEHRVRMQDHTFRWHMSRAQPSRDSQGSVVKWFGAAIDIHEQKLAQETLERNVQERTATLRDAVSELEHFSYTITHDMRAPLRAMQGFGQVLQEEYGEQLDAVGRDYLRRITQAADRMDALIRDALDYSKAVRTEFALEPLDPRPILLGLVESYPLFQPPRATIEIAPEFPLVQANQAGLIQCFSNLLGNAVKFVAPGVVPHVRIWPEVRGDRVRVWVADNGIGISPDQQERVFAMFQRLSKKYEGTGIGLSLVRKVAERMHGRVGLESADGTGSRFWLEFRRAPEARS